MLLKRILFCYFFLLLSICSFGHNNEKEPLVTCDERLKKALDKKTDKDRLTEAKKILKECSLHVPTRLALASLQQKIGEDEKTDWYKDVIIQYQEVLKIDSTHTEARFQLASIYEFLGVYSAAVKHFRYLSNNENVHKEESLAHLMTCQFLLDNDGDKAQAVSAEEVENVEKLDVSEEKIKERSGWNYLKELTAATAIAAGIKGLEGHGKEIQIALGFLFDCVSAPKEGKIETRNKMLVGLVLTIANIAVENSLNTKLGNINFQTVLPHLQNLPKNPYTNMAKSDFQAQNPTEGRRFTVSDNMTIEEKWDVHPIVGEWKCISGSLISSTSPNHIVACANNGESLIIKQQGAVFYNEWGGKFGSYPPTTNTKYMTSSNVEQKIVDNKCIITERKSVWNTTGVFIAENMQSIYKLESNDILNIKYTFKANYSTGSTTETITQFKFERKK